MEPTNVKTVQIIEDDADFGYAIIATLEAAGYKTIAAADGPLGLAMALANHPDVILLDLGLPKMNGQTVLQHLRADEWGKHVPVIVLTNEEDAQTIADSLQHSAQGYFIKADTNLDTVIQSVEDVLHHE